MRPLTVFGALTLVVAMLGTGVAGATTPDQARPRPQDARSGQAAIDMLGDDLRAVAGRHGMTPARLRELLLGDGTLRAEPGGSLFYVEPPEEVEGVEAVGDEPVFGGVAPLSETFALHSRPGSPRVIYLDFDGHSVNDAWASYFKVSVGHEAAAYDTDGDAGSFSDGELTAIQDIWRRMAEDFAVFDVDVTTQDPGQDAITRSGAADANFGTRVAFSSDAMKATCSCGGVAYVGVFDNTSSHDAYQPAWVFTTGAHNAAEAGSHEAGHNLGLSHDGTRTTGYYQGHGDWAPIMGVGYYEAITQWSKGEYSGANNSEDDFVVMQGNGIAVLADDHGGASAPTGLAGSSLAATGVIDSAADLDAFRFDAGAGTVTITVAPVTEGPNLDIALTLRDAGGAVIASADPPSTSVGKVASGLSATIVAVVPAGTYTLIVDGTGKGDPATTGYSDYGSVGRYTLAGSVVPGDGTPPPPPPPDIVPDAPASVTATAGQTGVELTWGAVDAADAYDVVRESRHKSGRWVGATTLATGVTGTTFTDTGVGNGTYRYLVRATNSVGASTWTSSNEVSVSGSTDGGGGGNGGGKGGGGGPKKSYA
jgi:hypothetical protein